MEQHTRSHETSLPIADESELLLAIVHVGDLARELGFDAVRRASVMTAASELGRNILKYAGRGTLRAASVQSRRGVAIEIVAEDRGPGIADVALALSDHYSTGGTLGLGLPGVRRLMDDFEIDSTLARGTRVTIRKWST